MHILQQHQIKFGSLNAIFHCSIDLNDCYRCHCQYFSWYASFSSFYASGSLSLFLKEKCMCVVVSKSELKHLNAHIETASGTSIVLLRTYSTRSASCNWCLSHILWGKWMTKKSRTEKRNNENVLFFTVLILYKCVRVLHSP